MMIGEEKNTSISLKGITSWTFEYIVTIIFVLFVVFGFIVSKGVSMNYFLSELNSRIFRNTFLVLSLIIPVLAGLGLNFGIVIGAMSGQAAVAIVRYYEFGGVAGFLLCFVISFFIAALCGFFTGKLYNKTRGQEMIASLIVGFFANGVYQFIFLFVVGVIIKVPATHPMIKPDGVGIRMTVDLIPVEKGGLKYALDKIYQIPFVHALLIISLAILAILFIGYYMGLFLSQGFN
jgi:simple sugar transport system permease protein